MVGSFWVAVAVAVPLAAALAALWPGRRAALLIAGLALPGSGLAAAGTIVTLLHEGPYRHPVAGWGAPLGIDLYVDGVAAMFLAVVTVIASLATLHALADPDLRGLPARRRSLFWSMWYMLWAALAALFASADIFNLYVTLELATLAGVALVTFGHGAGALVAAMRYLLAATLGSLAYLLGVALLYGAAGTLDLALLAERLTAGPAVAAAAGLMTIGLLVKAALFPLHVWLPPAHAGAPAAVSAVLSALVVKAGFYMLVRLWLGPFAGLTDPAAPVLGALGALGVVWGSLNALRQERLKLIVAYSTVAQIGYLFLLFPLAAGGALATAWAGAHYHALSHACAKAGAFLAAGNILLSHGDDRLGTISQGASRHRISLLAFALAGVSLMGLPPSGGFIAKWLLVTAAVEAGQWWWAAVVAGGGILAAAYVFRVLGLVMAAAPPEIPALRRVPRVAAYTALTLALAAIGLGLASAPPLALIGIGRPGGPDAATGAAMGAAEIWP